MIYRLPTRGATRYRGRYPHNARSISASQGVAHVELQNGERLIMRYTELLDMPRYGKDFRRYLRDQSSIAVNVNAFMYQALIDARPVTVLPENSQRALLDRWDAAFAGVAQ